MLTGPTKPLSVERIEMFLFCFIFFRRCCCWGVRFGGFAVGLKIAVICWTKVQIRESMSWEGSGGCQDNLRRRALGS